MEPLSELQRSILREALKGHREKGNSLPIYRILGSLNQKLDRNFLWSASLEELFLPIEQCLTNHGYNVWKLLVYKGFVYFLLGECKYRREASGVTNELCNKVWKTQVVLNDPQMDMPLERLNRGRYIFIGVREPVTIDVSIHEIMAQIARVDFISPEYLEKVMGHGKFQAAMETIKQVARHMEKKGLIILAGTKKLPGIILTREGYDISADFINSEKT